MALVQTKTFWRHGASSGEGGQKLDLNFAALDALFGPVYIRHADGTATGYPPAADTDLARGEAFAAAFQALVADDVLRVGGGTFDVTSSPSPLYPGGATVAAGVSVIGGGRDVTHIKRTVGEILYITNGSYFSSFTIEQDGGGPSAEPLLTHADCVNAWCHDLRLLNPYTKQGLWLHDDSEGLTLIDCEVVSGFYNYGNLVAYGCKFGQSAVISSGTLEAHRCTFRDDTASVDLLFLDTATGQTLVATLHDCDLYSADSGANSALLMDGGTLTMFGGRIRRPNGGKALYIDPAFSSDATATLYGVLLDGGTKDLQVDTGTLATGTANLHNCMFDPAKVTNNDVLNYLGGTGPQRTLEANLASVPTYADNAAAKAGGLVDGQLYRTATGALYTVYT